MIGKRKPQDNQDTQAVARVREALEGHWRQGAETVPVALVLDLLNSQGMWSRDPSERVPVQTAALPGDVDPITGCRSVQP